jgi:amino acid adenylation domain-containing protein
MTTKTLPPDAAVAVPKLSDLTPEQRALLVLRMRQKAAEREVAGGELPLQPVPREQGQELPLSFSQQRLWFMDRWQPESGAFNIPAALRVTGELDGAALRWSVSEIVRRHESLRTAFSAERLAQVVRPAAPLPVPVVDLEALAEEARAAELARLAGEDAARPFDLSRDRLLRVTLVRTAREEHAILLNMHHIVSDGWSMGVLVREFVTLYEARLWGLPSPLPELPVQYPDFAAWQRERLGGGILEEQLAWWRRTLDEAPAVAALPLARPRPALRSGRGFKIPFVLPEERTREVRALAQREGATLFMALLAAFTTLLSRFSGETDLVVGTAVAGRNRGELEGMIGFFVNSLALRVDLSGDPAFRDLLARAREVTVGAQGHQEVPFEKLVEELRPERDTSHPPIFQAVLMLENTPRSAIELAGLALAPLEVPSGTAQYDLTLSMVEVEARLEGFLEASRDLYDEISARRVLASFEGLLAGVLENPDRRLSELPLLSEAERWQIQGEWNDSALDRPRGTFIEAWEEQIGAWEDRPAVASGEESLTYGELNRRANQLAHHLRSLGVGPEVLVGLSMERSVEMVVGVLGIWKAGGAYVPLDPTYPMERLAGMMEETLLSVIVTQESVLDQIPTHFGFVVRLDADWDWIASSPDHNPEDGALPGNLAYTIFTSGSTGRPKGVLVAHGGVLNMAFAQAAVAGSAPGDPFLLVAPLAFDAAVFDIVMALFAGGTLWVARQEELLGPDLARLLAERGIASLTITPSALSTLPVSGDDLPALRRLWVAGEACTPELVARWAPGRRFFNAYGPTETTVWATVEEVSGTGTPPIGRPVANKTAYALDGRMRPVPAGVVGELFVGGEGTARGYLGRPDLTAERFVPDPLSGEPGARLYRTGDLVRQGMDGRLEFVGRNDQQVKIRGFRIELGEVEAALAEHYAVREAAVVVREERGDRRLAAFVTAPEGAEPAIEDLKAHLAERLPAYMVPASITALPALPLTPNGKVDRRALAERETEAAGAGRVWVAPRTPLEELLAGVLAVVLGVERVGLRDSFFDLGGHSLLATQVLSRVRESLGVEVPLAAFFEKPTVEGLAALASGDATSGAPPLVPAPREEHPPLSFAQQRLWFIQRLDPAGTAYNIPGAVRLLGVLNIPAFAQSLGEIVRRHEVLRTSFPEMDGRPFQAVSPWTPPALPIFDLTALPAPAREGEVGRLALEMARRPFDLARGPLLRLALARLSEEEHAALFVFHHIVFDGWSMGVLVGELAALYRSYVAGEASTLPEPAVQYADFSRWQRDWLSGDMLAAQVSWWTERLVGAPTTLDLPTDHPRPAVPSGKGRRTPFALGADLTRDLQALSRSRGTTLFMTLLAGVQTLLSRLSGQEDVSVGTPIAGRNRLETEGLLGFFVNTLVLRAGLADRPTFVDLLARARDMALGAYAHQDVPFELLVEELQPDRTLSHAPLFQVIFALQNTPAAALELPGLTLEPVDLEPGSARIDLSVEMLETPDGLIGWAEHSTDLFDEATIERWIGHLRTLLAAACAEPETRVSELPLLSDAERRQIVEEWSGGREAAGPDVRVHHLFAEQARREPERIALVDGDRELTYGELDTEAERLAGRLRTAGVGAETLVGVKISRSMEMVIAFLGALKAGGAYVPLDPGYPEERLEAMVEEAGVEFVVEASPRPRPHPPAPSPATPPPSPGEGEQDNVFAILPLSQGGGMGWWERGPGGEGREGEGSGGSLAYAMFTSGSTGRPKAVGVEHRGIVRLVRGADYADLGPDQTFLQLAPAAFDASTLEIWAPLLNGGRLVIFQGEPSSLSDLGEAIARHGVTTLWLTAGLFHQVVDHGIEILRPVRQLLAGGDVLSPAHVNRILTEIPGCRVINGYGPTENTTFTCCFPVPGPISPGRTVPVGRPISGTTVHVVDRELQTVPVGVAGELLTGGDGLARGYLYRPALTAERFVPDPFGPPGARLYRTGDLVCWRADGTIEFLGRLDDQVKIRGFRVEPGEVEAAVSAHPDVRQAAVAVADGAGGRRLVAYVAGEVSADDLRAWLRQRLPEHLVPSAVVLLPELPLTLNGKVDRKALPAPEAGIPERAGFAAPRTPVEEILAAIWAEVLDVERVGIEDGFFDLGGHSLSAIQVISRVRSAFGVELPLRLLFEEPTPAGLAPHVEEALRVRTGALAPPIVPVEREREIPLSFAQERLWFLEQLQPGTAAYNMGMAVEMDGALDVAALEAGLLRIVTRHEALRTRFPTVDGRPVQEIDPPLAHLLTLVDLSALPQEIRRDAARRLAEEETQRPFDLAAGPLVRAALLRLSGVEHVALLSLHHIVSDGWSMDVLVREMATFYAGGAMPDLLVQYADFADWQRRWLQGEVLEAEMGFWRDRLAGAPALTALPLDRPRPPVQHFAGDRFLAASDAELGDAVRGLARRGGATSFMVLLAAFHGLLARLTDETDLVAGVPTANRNRQEIEGLIGFFVNTLALRSDLSGDPDARTLLGRVREATLAAYAHQDLPFEKLVAEIAPQRDLSTSPLFQVLFQLQSAASRRLDLPGLALRFPELETGTAKFDLVLTFVETDEGISAEWRYATALFDGTTVQRLAGQFSRLLLGMAAAPGSPLSELPLLSEAERHQVAVEWNAPAGTGPEESLTALFEARAKETPEAVAVSFEGTGWTYADLVGRAEEIARDLMNEGVGTDSIVPITLKRGPEYVANVLGVLKAGGGWLPLDPGHPEKRRQEILARVRQDPPQASPSPGGRGGDGRGDRGEGLAYLLFTSGSTGLPKGVLVPRRGMENHIRAKIADLDLTAQDVIAQTASQSFDIHVWQSLAALAVGSRVAVFPDDVVRDPVLLAEAVEREGVTILEMVPSLLGVLLDALEQERPAFRSLRWLIPTGEALPPELARRWLALYPEIPLLNAYGPTEASDRVSHHPITAPPAPGVAITPIGRPIPGLRLRVLDAAFRPLPIGAPGELYIGGTGVGRGYLDDPARTAEVFLADPFGEPGARFYRTGDLARFLPDGTLEYLGRRDHQVKIRGVRIEAGEIEAALREHPGVREVVVVARDEPKRLVAYVVSVDAGTNLRAFLKERLPEAMIPAVFVEMEAFPRTPNGKLDRRALPAPAAGESRAAAQDRPSTVLEAQIAEAWREVLGDVAVGIEESFFELGGDSIKGAILVNRLQRKLERRISVADLFGAPTVAGLAAKLEKGSVEAAPPLVHQFHPDAAPLSFAQERLWFLQQLDPGTGAYNMPLAFRLRGVLDVPALAAAFRQIAQRHETLRTRYELRESGPVAVVDSGTETALPVADLTALPPEIRDVEARRLIAQESYRAFDLARGPVFRTLLLRLAGEDHALLFGTHHIAGDGWSLGLWAGEVEALYRRAALPDLPVQYADFARWQRGWLQGETLTRQIGYWRNRLAGSPPFLELPADHPRPPVQTFRGEAASLVLPADLVERLRSLGNRHDASLFMTLLAGFQLLLGRLSGQRDVPVGSPIAGRTRPEVEGLIGCFLNTLVLRTDLAGNPSFAGLLGRVRETSLGAYAHQDVPFEKVLEELAPERDLSRSSLFQVMFNMLNAPASGISLPGLTLQGLALPEVLAKFDLTLYVAEREEGHALELVYNADLFDRPRMEEMLRQYWGVLVQAADDPERAIETFSLLTPEAAAALPNPAAALGEEWIGAVHDLFGEQARTAPDRLAIVDRDGSLTYGELDAAVRRFAGRLIADGVRPGDRVALYAHRSAPLVTAILGVLKAGAAYVVLDPAYPAARLAEIVRLAEPRAVIHLDLPAGPIPDAWPSASPADLACISFTSGSTGIPKGILQTHGSMSHFLPWQRETFGFGEGDRFTLLSGLAHDPLQRDLFHALCLGASLHIPDPDRIGEPGYLAGWMRGERITVANLTPAMAQLLTEGAGDVLPDLRLAVLGGDLLTRRDVARLRRLAPRVQVVNFYGSTESHRALAWHRVEEGDRPKQTLPLGRGMRDVQLLVLAVSGALAGVGELGEVAIRSPHLAAGYLGGERFGEQVRTGDLGRYLPNGEVEAAGRADQQVKIRGFRVEPGEIEAELGRIPGVREAVVLAREDGAGERRLVAYVVLAEERSVSDLRDALRDRLPAYMVPTTFVALDRLPLNPNGKVDRRALPDPGEAELAPAGERVAPRDELELRLAKIWEETLGTPVGVTDDFFDLGGHSLLAVRLAARIEHELGISLPLAVLFQHSTIEKLAGLLRAGEVTTSALVPLRTGGALPPLFLVHPAGGQILCYAGLVPHLGENRPVYALQDVAPPDAERSLSSLTAAYIPGVRSVQPAGPYHLAGWSFGGRVAFEMARQLREAGEEVAFLGMIDTGLVTPPDEPEKDDAALLLEVVGEVPMDLDELRQAADPVAALVERAREAGLLPTDFAPAAARRILELVKAHLRIARTDRPQPYPGPVTFFAAAEQPPEAGNDPAHGWGEIAGEIEVHRVPGSHTTMIYEPENVRVLGERVRKLLESRI